MTHRSDDSSPLHISHLKIEEVADISTLASGFTDVYMIVLPPHSNQPECLEFFKTIEAQISNASAELGPDATLVVIGEPVDLVHVHTAIQTARFQLWINIKRQNIRANPQKTSLSEHHFGALVYTKYTQSLQHTITRLEYTYCPACDKTTKDYGGKKHTYNSYGTLISDVWRDIACDLESDLSPVVKRFADLFGLDRYKELRLLDCRELWQRSLLRKLADAPGKSYIARPLFSQTFGNLEIKEGKLLRGDCLEQLRRLPDNSVDFAFIDPPYNLGKNYHGYADDRSIQEYFAWCDEWIQEVERVLRPGRTVAILNIPLWAIRHFLYMETILTFQNWIAWDALSFPVRKIMPAHYAIICFSKGESRPLPGLVGEAGKFNILNAPDNFLPLEPMEEGYCLRSSCIQQRNFSKIVDRGALTDLWWDIHRLKHNSRRVDHPCQLPPHLMYRLISIFTKPGEVVLDCFDGAGTTSLAAHQLSRQYIGIELSEKYHSIALARHEEIVQGLDPFRKAERKLTEKNSRVARMPKVIYEVPKKTLQLEVRRVARELNRLPNRDEMIKYGKYPIRYYDEYFASWGEVCAAARHDGMTEVRSEESQQSSLKNSATQLGLFGSNGAEPG
jgi:DNA modification methylase